MDYLRALVTVIGWINQAIKAYHDAMKVDEGRSEESQARETAIKNDVATADSVRADVAVAVTKPDVLRAHDEFERP